ncbi:MAG: methionine-S-sulfoxide reductase [Candidatus Paceibacteria bacterium]|jgi:methionine-S-sulfoxide reductase
MMLRSLSFALFAVLACACRAGGGELLLDSHGHAMATLAGGCFWCLEASFEELPGVERVLSGYTGGQRLNPTDEEVSEGGTGHAEAIQVFFDSERLSYEELLDYFWRQIDPTDSGGQFDDRGDEYRTCIYYHSESQRTVAMESRRALGTSERFVGEIVTRIELAPAFYLAAERHQDFCTKNPDRYRASHAASGRDEFFKSVWSMDSKAK